MIAALFGSVAPDLDMLYFHLIDGRQTHHHDYFTHWPLFWLAAGAALASLVYFLTRPFLPAVLTFTAAALLHMVLDTVATPLLWLMPFSDRAFELVTVPAAFSHWIISFMLHWTFALEITICLAALAMFLRRRRRALAISTNLT